MLNNDVLRWAAVQQLPQLIDRKHKWSWIRLRWRLEPSQPRSHPKGRFFITILLSCIGLYWWWSQCTVGVRLPSPPQSSRHDEDQYLVFTGRRHRCFEFHSVLSHCWLDDSRGIWPVNISTSYLHMFCPVGPGQSPLIPSLLHLLVCF